MFYFSNICSLIITVSFGDCVVLIFNHPCEVKTVELLMLFIGTYVFNIISILKLLMIPILNKVL